MVSKIKETKESYIKRAVNLMHKAYREADKLNHEFASQNYFITYKDKKYKCISTLRTSIWAKKYWAKTIRPNTWRQYRASLIYYAELMHEKGNVKTEALEKIKGILQSTQGGDKKELTPKTSASKKKTISEKDFRKLDDALKKSKNKWASATRLWLKCSILTGLRPIEWTQSKIVNEGNEVILVIENAKNTNGRSIGKYRHISLNHLDKDEIKLIQQNIKISQQFKSQELWDKYYQGCSNVLKYTSRKVFKYAKRFPTLYTGRHQFSANLKVNGYKPNEIASLMGHISDLTNQEHYGRKVYGTKGAKTPKVNANDLRKVKVSQKKSDFKYD